ncbi:PHP domain-containing protein [Gemmatimonas phototrophica]|uniref:PHP domain-containing protein n=1 Tax=Gemmatimonas phototrophica TaxID=1379270 RepID=UPI0006A70B1F|nr:PHP domain-containing protein [Gemmatimonas phototrophica]
MDCRSAGHALNQIAVLLELHGEDTFTVKAMQLAARSTAALGERELPEALRRELAGPDALAPAALEVLRDLAESNSSSLLERLQEETPEGLMEMLRVPGLGPARIRSIHDNLHIDSLQELEQAAQDGRLAALPKFGARTADKVLKGLADLRATGAYVLWQHARAEAERVADALRDHADVLELAIAGSIRRRMEIVRDVDIVAAVRGSPSIVAASLAQLRGVKEVFGGGGRSLALRLDNGVRVDLACVRPEQFALALWRATGSMAHVKQVTERAATLGFTLTNDELRDADGAVVSIATEQALYEQLNMSYVPPEQREAAGEVEAAARGALPLLVQEHDLRGALHCHSQYSDGAATIEQMSRAAYARGLRYLGVSDHSQSNTYAGGLSRDRILEQHAEIDALNASFAAEGLAFRVLKGIEADILPCGRVDYDAAFLDHFDFVIGSVHTRYGMNAEQMTNRVLKALDDPHLTILGHPTGRLLLTREPYAINLEPIMEKAAQVGVAIELNADPHRLDIDWRACRIAAEKGAMVSIGPDAHSPQGFDNLELGVAVARKGWLSATNVLNTRSAEEVMAFAAARRSGAGVTSLSPARLRVV